VRVLASALTEFGVAWEIIVVDDGGGDFTQQEWSDNSRVRLITETVNRGKGAAVRAGMLAAKGAVRIFTDVDLPYGTDLIPVMASYLNQQFHVVIGDRTLPDSRYRQTISPLRRFASTSFTAMVGTMVTGGFFDTQCGLKAVRGDVADALFPLLQVERFAFDVELVYVALKHRLDIKRIPVRLLNNETSSVRLLRDSMRGAVDLVTIKANQVRGLYKSSVLDDIVRRDFGSACTHAAQQALAAAR
jgi:dolichyl-phosphate beta-glucosyltransferase